MWNPGSSNSSAPADHAVPGRYQFSGPDSSAQHLPRVRNRERGQPRLQSEMTARSKVLFALLGDCHKSQSCPHEAAGGLKRGAKGVRKGNRWLHQEGQSMPLQAGRQRLGGMSCPQDASGGTVGKSLLSDSASGQGEGRGENLKKKLR